MDNISTMNNNEDQEDDFSAKRREERIARDNLLREYSSRKDNFQRELTEKQKVLDDLSTKIRFGGGTINANQHSLISLEGKLERLKRNLKRDKYELRLNKDKVMKIEKEVEFLTSELAGVEKRLKKIKIEGK